jgi:hypothetical protein
MNKIFKDIKNLVTCFYTNSTNEQENPEMSNSEKKTFNTLTNKNKIFDSSNKETQNEGLNYLDSLKELQRTFMESNKDNDNILSRKSSFQTFEHETLVIKNIMFFRIAIQNWKAQLLLTENLMICLII